MSQINRGLLKNKLSARFEQDFKRYLGAGNTPQQFAVGQSGGKVKWQAGDAAKQAMKQAHAVAIEAKRAVHEGSEHARYSWVQQECRG